MIAVCEFAGGKILLRNVSNLSVTQLRLTPINAAIGGGLTGGHVDPLAFAQLGHNTVLC